MPIETGAVGGVRPVARPQAPGGIDGVNRRDGESTPSGFRPQTNVSIENAVSDMAGILSKISSEEMETVEKMPQDLQKVIENVMKQAFSFDQTLAEGLGSTMESQRFSMEQLTTVARTLLQMSSLAEKGYDVNISDGLQTLLTNLKAAVTQETGGNAFEPVLLLKASFDLINGKDPQDLPAALQQLIASMQTAGAQGQQAPASDAPGFLKQLVQYFMPRSDASAEGGAQTAGQSAAQEGKAAQGQATAQTAQQGTAQTGQAAQGQQTQNGGAQQGAQGAPQGQNAAGNTAGTAQNAQNTQQGGQPQNAQGQTAQANAQTSQAQQQGQTGQTSQGTQGQPAQGQAAQGQTAQAQGQAAVQNSTAPQTSSNANGTAQGNNAGQPAAEGQPKNGAQTANGQNAQNTSQSARQQGAAWQQQPGNLAEEPQAPAAGQAQQNVQNAEGQPAARSQQQAPMQGQEQLRQMPQAQENQNLTMTAREAKELLMQQPMQNTPESMQTLKDLARLFLQKGTLSQADANLLQNFVDGQGRTLQAKESRQLETLLRLCQQNIPATVQQAALQHDMPELPRLWAFMQLCDLSVAKKLNARQLKKAGKDVAEFVFSMRGSMEGDHAIQPGQRSMNFMMPLYLGENEKSYPAYIHVYDETKPDKETGALKKETWLRLCVLTENLGAVELTCRVYEHEHLDMRLFFANRETAAEFRDHVPELRRSMRGSKLHLEDVAVGAPGE